ncbi:membrane protein [Luteimonas sp. FCS-9]|uniref:CopD family copper resistance protein n=1 Tax=Luteimonas sp. FCS-9 TaxID=1547516 RepID=UPI00063E9228|nr:membrane protein [Luteimonas sp. FCS-9]KLJ01157.1 membrane protein [Luteimonas sp. FCS-9]
MSHYALLHVLHLFAAIVFVGTVFFEVLILEGVRRHVPRNAMHQIEVAIGARARRLMPWVLLALYGSGLGMAWRYRALLAHPLASSFGTLLTIKIVLALSVFAHFLFAMRLRSRGRLVSSTSKRLHLSVFAHMVGIVLLAKLMFHLGW